jgi:UTP--glucose-1-phosphate uridylyltransferase
MVEAYEQTGGNMVAAMEVPPAKASAYGVLDIAEDMGSIVKARGMVEKPKANEAPSNLAVIGRYILSPEVLNNLNAKKLGAGGEIQLTDAIAEETRAGGTGVYGYRFSGQRYDCGSKAGFLQATVAFGLSRPDLQDEFATYLHDVVAQQKAAQ